MGADSLLYIMTGAAGYHFAGGKPGRADCAGSLAGRVPEAGRRKYKYTPRMARIKSSTRKSKIAVWERWERIIVSPFVPANITEKPAPSQSAGVAFGKYGIS
jgi:hypothetical protein